MHIIQLTTGMDIIQYIWHRKLNFKWLTINWCERLIRASTDICINQHLHHSDIITDCFYVYFTGMSFSTFNLTELFIKFVLFVNTREKWMCIFSWGGILKLQRNYISSYSCTIKNLGTEHIHKWLQYSLSYVVALVHTHKRYTHTIPDWRPSLLPWWPTTGSGFIWLYWKKYLFTLKLINWALDTRTNNIWQLYKFEMYCILKL